MRNIALSVIRRIRPNAAASADSVRFGVMVGWYVRKGALPMLRGAVLFWRFGSANFPLFLGRNCSLHYARKIRVGESCFIGAGSAINALSENGVELGDRVTLREGSWIQCSSHPRRPGVGLNVGSDTYIGPNVIIGVGGPIRIGRDCQVGARCTFIAENHLAGEGEEVSATEVSRRGIEIGNGCWIGHGATILDGVVLGPGCVVGAGAVVTKSFPAGSRIGGVPARPLGVS